MAGRASRCGARSRRCNSRSDRDTARTGIRLRGSSGARASRTPGLRDPMNLRIEQDGRLCRIALASPEDRNILDAAACRDLLRELRDAAADDATGAILIEADGQIF